MRSSLPPMHLMFGRRVELRWGESEEEEKEEGKRSGWVGMRSSVLCCRGWSLGKKVVIAGAAITSAPVLIPPLLLFSTLIIAFAFPFGVYFAGFACTDRIMKSLLQPPIEEAVDTLNEEEEEKTGMGEERKEVEEEGKVEVVAGEKGNGGMVEEGEAVKEAGGSEEKREVKGEGEEGDVSTVTLPEREIEIWPPNNEERSTGGMAASVNPQPTLSALPFVAVIPAGRESEIEQTLESASVEDKGDRGGGAGGITPVEEEKPMQVEKKHKRIRKSKK